MAWPIVRRLYKIRFTSILNQLSPPLSFRSKILSTLLCISHLDNETESIQVHGQHMHRVVQMDCVLEMKAFSLTENQP